MHDFVRFKYSELTLNLDHVHNVLHQSQASIGLLERCHFEISERKKE